MAFLNSLNITGSALTAERYKTDVILQNIANQNVAASSPEEAYQRKQVVFRERAMTFDERMMKVYGGGVRVTETVELGEDVNPVYDPDNPLADEDGYIYMPNVNNAEEQIDLLEATRAYEANLTALSVVKAMAAKGLEIGKGG
ncbi:flagellar basal body rod protein FlgC [Ruminococcus sp. NK3A76]|uniref:flagellar basal body rod protein FlgC n=1 Tax=Ruminococcus sp. NK3A76 TaxID=877411 RepID=UPI00048EB2CF|nr:flagellar basal body rod protein FlgC [Ruminococcus sp. NK3A76]